MRQIVKDIDIVHRRRWPGRPMSLTSCLTLLASSAGLRLLLMHRLSHWLRLKRNNSRKNEWLLRMMLIPFELLKLAIKINTKSDIGNDCEIEGGVSFSDQGYIIFGALKTGTGTVIGNRVTLGKSHVDNGKPEIGRNVWIGSDCVVYGGIRIGDGATLLPGTVLTKNIPAGVVMQGNPARLVLRHFDNSVLRERQDADALQCVNSVRIGNDAKRPSPGIVLSNDSAVGVVMPAPMALPDFDDSLRQKHQDAAVMQHFNSVSIANDAMLPSGIGQAKKIPAGADRSGNPVPIVLPNFDNSVLQEQRNVGAMHYAKTE